MYEVTEATASVKFVGSVKNLACLPVKIRYFPHNKSTIFFPFDIDRVIRQMQTCMQAHIHTLYRDIHTLRNVCMNSYIQTSPSALSHRPQAMGKWVIVKKNIR